MRTYDFPLLDKIANMPEVRPKLGGKGDINLETTVMNPANYTFTIAVGGFIVVRIMDGVYEAHSVFTPDRRGVLMIVKLMEEVQAYMFLNTDCHLLVTKIPTGHDGAAWLAKRGGFVLNGHQGNWDEGKGADVMHFPLDTWARVCYRTLEAGRQFHEALEAAKKLKHSELPTHEDDELHDRMAGTAVLMAQAGNVVKGVNFYNNWAVQYGYQPIVLVSEQPAVVDVGDAIVGVEGGKMEVMLCR